MLCRAAAIICLLLFAALSGGCNVIGAAAYIAAPPTIHALYLPAKSPMLVLVEPGINSAEAMVDAEQLERFVIEQVKYHDVAPLADLDSVYTLRLSDPNRYRKMSIAQLGKLAGAQQVLYVDLQTSGVEMSPGSEMMHGQAAARVRVVDVESGETLWPTDMDGGYPLQHESPIMHTDRYTTAADIRRSIQQSMADGIVRLFYSYKQE